MLTADEAMVAAAAAVAMAAEWEVAMEASAKEVVVVVVVALAVPSLQCPLLSSANNEPRTEMCQATRTVTQPTCTWTHNRAQ